jgi:hypothetical protein
MAKESAHVGSADAKAAGNLLGSASAPRSPMESITLHWNTSVPIKWDKIVLRGQYILDVKLVRRAPTRKMSHLSV